MSGQGTGEEGVKKERKKLKEKLQEEDSDIEESRYESMKRAKLSSGVNGSSSAAAKVQQPRAATVSEFSAGDAVHVIARPFKHRNLTE